MSSSSLPPPPMRSASPPPMPPPMLSYASPVMSAGAGVWRRGDRVVATRDADFGDACVKCGAACDGWRWRKTVYWHEPWLFVLILFPGLLIYAIVALCVRKNARVSAGLCPAHRARRNLGIAVTWALALLGAGALVGGMIVSAERGGVADFALPLVLFGFALIVVAVVVGNTVRVLTPKKIDRDYAWYAGATEPFLRTLGGSA